MIKQLEETNRMEQISNFIDNEIKDYDMASELLKSESAKDKLTRYELIGSILRKELPASSRKGLGLDFAARIQTQLVKEEAAIHVKKPASQLKLFTDWWTKMGKYSVPVVTAFAFLGMISYKLVNYHNATKLELLASKEVVENVAQG